MLDQCRSVDGSQPSKCGSCPSTKEIKEVTKDVQVSGVVNKSIREIQAAIMLAITTSIVVSTVVSN